jgi:hypothetical protein
MILTGNHRRTRRKTCSSAILSTTNHTRTDAGANPGLRFESICNLLNGATNSENCKRCIDNVEDNLRKMGIKSS